MSDFENKIMSLTQVESGTPDAASFLTKLRGRQNKEMIRKQRSRSGFFAFVFIFLIGTFTSSQLKDLESQYFDWSEIDNSAEFFDTDFSTFEQENDTLSIEEFTLFLIEENNVWDTEDLIYFNELYETKNEYEASL
ncbi:MAG: hypothetical protein VYC61_02355 [Candidatus Neomarinimicrobiota bacterium]|jgi:hypothetical protein|nr:hypothetical protein [Candidatus Neomarinimicrobiota bacterium]|tara:strand:- start:158 stop:565 length:408 start_codon:yes stop_codon:yes gene_type:complete